MIHWHVVGANPFVQFLVEDIIGIFSVKLFQIWASGSEKMSFKDISHLEPLIKPSETVCAILVKPL